VSGDVYYPQCWVRFQIRFEDYIQLPQPVATPAIPNTDPVDYGFQLVDEKIIPKQASVTLNSYRNADEATVVIPYGKLPLDPRWIRAATIQIFMGTLDASDFSDGIGPIYGESQITLIDETPNLVVEGVIETNEIFRGRVDDWEISQDGDDTITVTARDISAVLIDAEMPSSGLSGIPKLLPNDAVIRQIIVGDPQAQTLPPDRVEERPRRLDSRRDVRRLQIRLDYVTQRITKTTAALAQEPLNTALANELGRLQVKQAQILAALATSGSVAAAGDAIPILSQRYGLPSLRGLKVVNKTGEPLPALQSVKAPTYFDSKGTAKKARSGGSGDKISYWDFITDIVVGAGYICYFRTPTEAAGAGALGQLPPAELVIDLPRTYYPQAGGEIRTFIYGYNVDSLAVKRQFTGQNVPTGIAVSAIEHSTGQVITSRFPPIEQVNRPSANGTGLGDRTEYKTISLKDRIPASIGGATAQQTLDRIAESLYEQLSRGEFIVNIETTTLAAFGSNVGTGQADMLQLRAGDPIEIQISASDPTGSQPNVTQAGNFTALGLLERGRKLVEDFGLSPVAAALAATASESELQQEVFYTREVGVDFDAEAGFSFSIEAINYVDARNAVRQQLAGINAAQELIQSFGDL